MSIIEFRGVRLRPMTIFDQDLVLKWRCDPIIANVMYTKIINPNIEAQIKWFRSMEESVFHEYWII